MGGNALKNIKIDRIKTEDIKALQNEVSQILFDSLFLGVSNVGFPKFYSSKKDHGDLDVVVSLEDYNLHKTELFKNLILKKFQSRDHYFNSNVFSIEFKNHQVDLIFTEPKYFYSHCNYYSFNDLGNFIGRTAHKMGFKYGEKGLLCNFTINNGHSLGIIELSKNTENIFEFLGYDYKRWNKGFNEIEEVFEFVISSKYFSGTAFSLEEQNNTNRTRNSKRDNWMKFCNFLNERNLLDKSFNFESKEFYLEKALKFFNKENEFNSLLSLSKLEKERSEKFNGNIVSKLTNLQKEELGKFIVQFKNRENWNDFIDSKNKEQIENEILDFFNSDNFKLF